MIVAVLLLVTLSYSVDEWHAFYADADVTCSGDAEMWFQQDLPSCTLATCTSTASGNHEARCTAPDVSDYIAVTIYEYANCSGAVFGVQHFREADICWNNDGAYMGFTLEGTDSYQLADYLAAGCADVDQVYGTFVWDECSAFMDFGAYVEGPVTPPTDGSFGLTFSFALLFILSWILM